MSIRVLLVDDETEFVDALAERLSLRDIETIASNDGQEALELIDKVKPDVVVLDLIMPGVSGYGVLRRMKDEYPDIPVILISGKGETTDGIDAAAPGVFGFLVKPIIFDQLIAAIRRAARK